MSLSRYFAPAVLAASLGLAAVAAPAQAQSSDLVRVLVNVADVVMRGNTPYYRNGDYGYDDRLIAQRDQYGRVVYYRNVPSQQYYGNTQPYGSNQPYRSNQPPYGNAYGYYRNAPVTGTRAVKCNKHGKCKSKTEYYDPRYDRDGRYGNTNARYDRDGRRNGGRDHDHDHDD